jgi:transcription elongation factor GreA
MADLEEYLPGWFQLGGAGCGPMPGGRVSISSPLAKALIGKKVGESISVPAPGGDRSYEILGIKFL